MSTEDYLDYCMAEPWTVESHTWFNNSATTSWVGPSTDIGGFPYEQEDDYTSLMSSPELQVLSMQDPRNNQSSSETITQPDPTTEQQQLSLGGSSVVPEEFTPKTLGKPRQ